jgi:flagellin
MSTIGSNVAALKSLHNLRLNEDGFAKATERLSSGKRLNSAGDDAAGAAIVNRMSSQIAGMNVAIRNAGDAISMSQVAEGALHEVSEVLQRMRELAVQAANGSYSGADRVSLNQEVVSLKKELIRIGETTTFNTTKLLNGTFQDTEFEISFDESPQHTHSLSIEDIRPNKIGMWNMSSQTEKSVEVSAVADYAGQNASAQITTVNDHDFKVGDIVTYVSSGSNTEQIIGLVSGRSYKVETVGTKVFTLKDFDGGNIGYGAGTVGGDPLGSGAGARFFLNSLGNAPSIGEVGADPASSEVLGAEELEIYGYVGKETAKFKNGASAREIANSINAIESKTGVVASASTHARLTLQPDNSTDAFTTISFDLYGMNTTAVPITASVKFGTGNNSAYPDLSDLRTKINAFSGDTGITAKLSTNGADLDLTSADGYDILIDNYDLPLQSRDDYNSSAQVNATNFALSANSTTAAVAESTAAHGFVTGDVVRAEIGNNETQTWLTQGGEYVVTVLSNTTFSLSTFDANGTESPLILEAPQEDNADTMFFTKIEKGLKIQTLDRDENLKGTAVTLFDKDILATRTPAAPNSVRLTGQVMFESPSVFTVNPKTDQSLFRDDPESASLRKISDMDVLSVRNAQRMMSAVDGALRKVDAERGDLGATMNRMEHTIDNLSNIVVNTTVSRGRIEDADMAEESVNLSKSQVLQQAATAMLAQANQSMQSVLDLLR